MQAQSRTFPAAQIAQRWYDLANRRRSHFIELYASGRWKLYYSEAEFIIRLQEAFQVVEQWEKLAAAWRSDPPG
jgi:uncharacterized repeat protein (TIGR03809 family)